MIKTPKIKSRKLLISILAILSLIIILLIIPQTRNNIFRAFLNDKAYFLYIINSNLPEFENSETKNTNSPSQYHSSISITPTSTYESALNMFIDSNQLSNNIQKYSNISSNLTLKHNFCNNEVTADITFEDNTQEKLSIIYNSDNNTFYYNKNNNIISKSFDNIYANIFNITNKVINNSDNYELSRKKAIELALNSLTTLPDSIKNLQIQDTTYKKFSDIDIDCEHFSMELPANELKLLINNILDTLSEDEEFTEILTNNNISAEDISKISEHFFNYIDNFSEKPFIIDVYADEKGRIFAATFTLQADKSDEVLEFGFAGYKKGKETFTNLNINIPDKQPVSLYMHDKIKKDVHNGTITVELPDFICNTINLEYSDIELVNKNSGYFEGNVTITPSLLNDLLHQKIIFKSDGTSQDIESNIKAGGKNIISIDINYYSEEYEPITIPEP